MFHRIHQHRGILATIASAALVLGLAGTAVGVWVLRLPHPMQANRSQLVRWLVLRDLQHEPLEIRQCLVNRLQDELHAGPLVAGGGQASLSEPLRQRLNANCELLQHDWFLIRSAEYAALPRDERTAFLDHQVATLIVWCKTQQQLADSGSADQIAPVRGSTSPADSSSSSQAGSSAGAAARFFDCLQDWLQAAPPDRRPILERAVTDGFACWLSSGDLQEESPDFRDELATRIADSLDHGATGDGIANLLSDARRSRFSENCLTLMESWLLLRAREYESMEIDQRQTYVDKLIDRVSGWDLSSVQSPEFQNTEHQNTEHPGMHAPTSASSRSVWLQLAEQSEQWIERAPPERQRSLRRLVAHVQRRVLWRQLQALLPSRN